MEDKKKTSEIEGSVLEEIDQRSSTKRAKYEIVMRNG